MDDLTGKLMELLSDKDNIEKIKSLSGLINNSTTDDNVVEKCDNENSEKQNQPNSEKNENDIIPIEAIQTVMKLMPVLSSMNKDDDNTRLLCALRPHLSEKRRIKLDESMKMLQMFKLLPLLKSQGIF